MRLGLTMMSMMRVGLLCAVVAGVAAASACSRSGETPPPAQGSSPAQAALPDGARAMVAWLPEDNVLPGWTRTREPRYFSTANLWEYIDGAAETYLGFQFQDLVTIDLVNKATGVQIGVDVYRMATPLGAFGIYAQESPPTAEFLSIGAEGYQHGTALNFWSDSVYVKLTSGKEHPTLAPALRGVAEEMARRIGGTARRPAEFDRFPTESLVARSFKVVPKDLLGQSYLTGAFEAQYRSGTSTWTLAYLPFNAGEESARALDRYRTFLATNGKIVRPLTSPGLGGFVGQDSYYGVIVAARAERAMAVAAGPPSAEAGIDAVARLLK